MTGHNLDYISDHKLFKHTEQVANLSSSSGDQHPSFTVNITGPVVQNTTWMVAHFVTGHTFCAPWDGLGNAGFFMMVLCNKEVF